jgi:cell division protein FtsL
VFHVGKRNKDLGVRKRSLDRKFTLGPNSIKVIAVVILAAFSLFYLSQSSQSATRDYIVSDLESQKKDLNSERERMEVEANRLKALSLIQTKAGEKGMEQSSQ